MGGALRPAQHRLRQPQRLLKPRNKKFRGDGQIRTAEWSFCRALPYHLATSPIINTQRVAGIEPARRPWEGHRLPLHHTRPLGVGPRSRYHLLRPTTGPSTGAPGCSAERAGVVWIYAIPAWLFIPAAVIGSCLVAGGLLTAARKHLLRSELISHNDVAGPILSTIGTVLAVMMSFMVIGVWQEYDGSAQTVQFEAGALSDLHHLADGLRQPVREDLKNEVDRYINSVIYVEWPLMRHGGESQVAHDQAYRIELIVARITPHTAAESNLQQTALTLTQRFLDDRRQRIHDNRQGIPLVLWGTMMFIGALTVLFSFYFRVDRPFAQLTMVVALTAVISSTFVLIAELDYPFRGDIAISPESFVHVYDTIHNIGLQQ